LLIAELDRGHFKVAARHFLMLQACGAAIPPAVAGRCETIVSALPSARLARIVEAVDEWRRMVWKCNDL
jgi:hypothetical protein